MTLDLAARLVDRGALDDAAALLDAVAPADGGDRLAALRLAARIAANGKDFDARFGLAALHAHDGDFGAAFDQLLEVVLRDKGDWREKARVQLVEWFTLCPDAEVVSRGRRYLGMYLN